MKARLFIMALMVAFTSFANAQEQQVQPNPEIVAQVKKMTERMLLDDSKAEKFEPLYHAYLEEKAACSPQLVEGDDLTDLQLEANMKACLESREKVVEIDKKYYKKFSKLLNAKQLNMIFGEKVQLGKSQGNAGGGACCPCSSAGCPRPERSNTGTAVAE